MQKIGIDLSYMDFYVDSQPVYTNGKPCFDLMPEESGGSWTCLGKIQVNPDMKSVMRYYNIINMSEDQFVKIIIAHELAHEIWHKIASMQFKQIILKMARLGNFMTKYLKTVKPEKLQEETFCEYLAHIITKSESADLIFRQVQLNEVQTILECANKESNNERLDINKFKECLDPKFYHQQILWYGCFRLQKCMALSVLMKTPTDCILLADIQSITKGYGKPLIENILVRSKNIWWCADPKGGDSLLNYYRQFGLNEHLIKMSKWTNTPETAFYKADAQHEPIILDCLDKADMTSPKYVQKKL